MRALMTVASIATLAALAGCSEETCSDGSAPVDDECPCADGTYPSDNEGGECPDDGVECGIGETEVNGECLIECDNGDFVADEIDCPLDLDPAAVGFEFDGVFDGANLGGYMTPDGAGGLVELPPLVLVTFANIDFFSATTEEDQLRNSCEAFATFDVIAGESLLVPASMDGESVQVWNHFETSLSIIPGSWQFEGDTPSDDGCAFALDSDLWGDGGSELLNSFTTFRFGIGFGPLTEYLQSAWQDEAGEWANETIEELSVGMMTSYIAINDAEGANDSTEAFEGFDWTTSVAFELDDTTGELVADEEGLLQVIDVTGANETPVSYIRSFAYWYQDFPLLDLDDMGTGRPVDGGSR